MTRLAYETIEMHSIQCPFYPMRGAMRLPGKDGKDRYGRPNGVDEVHRCIGRNVLLYQRIELALKETLPFIHPKGGASGYDALKDLRSQLKKATLGGLLSAFGESAAFDPIELKRDLENVLAARNRLSHTFLAEVRFCLLNDECRNAAIRTLDAEYEAAECFMRVIGHLASEIAQRLQEAVSALPTPTALKGR